jgi:protein-S-isoprenylcysteine O-methyltransferase Ste14
MQSTLSMLAFVLMVAGIFGLNYTGALFSGSPTVIGIQLLAVLLMIWARVTFGRRSFHAAAAPTAGGLVKTGPYRFLRHPIYTAAFLFVWPAALNRGSSMAIGFALLVSVGAIIRMLCEEHLLVRQYPEYVEYAGTTKRMIPYVF